MTFDAVGVFVLTFDFLLKIYLSILWRFSLPRIPLSRFLAYVRASGWDFCIIRGPPTVPLTRISRNMVFFKSQNPLKAGTLCTLNRWYLPSQSVVCTLDSWYTHSSFLQWGFGRHKFVFEEFWITSRYSVLIAGSVRGRVFRFSKETDAKKSSCFSCFQYRIESSTGRSFL